ncbi:stage IV sporulation protein A [Anaerofustis stercorihominis]|uniref:Stage IV sporulation protein A n=2 Tax=Anaerofustis stercorihominis TaxID=214853 RepID=B1CB41_9FIRM|nr:stage IV sporulation protein A [Anaerofustis stercorihominis]EDS71488.1 stage IV sporulation protein A [Anaerofustis stercorihominis DSM 17244]MCQ4795580.1 stage IV sporulation protein A [Anaerofustis stercorihominis]
MNLGIYEDISKRTGSDIYLGVVGPVRSGKSTFIKKFMDVLVIPNIENKFKRERAVDELPQSGSGKTIMTCEPKFVPNTAANINLGSGVNLNVRLVDCVGYVIPGAVGDMDENEERMIRTPWSDSPMPFKKAAEIGTKKVIEKHSTIGIVVTTDGSISGIERNNYIEAEEKVINELKEINKPFVTILNTTTPNSKATRDLGLELEEKYECKVIVLDVMNITLDDIEALLKDVLFEFPIKEINYSLPLWLDLVREENTINNDIYDFIKSNSNDNDTLNKVIFGVKNSSFDKFGMEVTNIDLSSGIVDVDVKVENSAFYDLLSEKNDIEINGESDLFGLVSDLTQIKREYEKIASALSLARSSGYGVVMPEFEDYKLEEPEMISKSSRHGVKIKACAPALHIICTDVETSVSPTIGSEEECQVFYDKLIDEYKNDQDKIWESEFFGRNLKNMISDNMQNKLISIEDDNKMKIQKTLTKVVNSGKGGIILLWL